MAHLSILKTLKALSVLLAAVVGLAAAASLVIQFRIRLENQWQQYAFVDSIRDPTKLQRILVFAPHCDDETLGCGGLLALAARNGAKARVVLITNGDGYRLAAGARYKTVRVTPDKCIKFAYARQQETLRALRVLGVSTKSVTFLGYPDHGIARMWDRNWSRQDPYVSTSTGLSRSPYHNSRTPNALYCGESLVEDIQGILREERPTDVYVPHPEDNHSDHYATYCFVTAALEQVREQDPGVAESIKIHTYLVHRGDWPTPRGYHPNLALAPPYALVNAHTRWYALGLPSDVVKLKLKAIRQYSSQISLQPGFLTSFARVNEVFGELPVRSVKRVPQNTIKVDGKPEDWAGIPPCVVNPVGDYLVANVSRGGDLRTIYVCADANYIYFRVDCAGKLSRRINYVISLRGIGRAEATEHLEFKVRPPYRCIPDVASVRCGKNLIEFVLPRKDFKFAEDIYIRVVTKLATLTVDNTGWHRMEFSRKPSAAQSTSREQD